MAALGGEILARSWPQLDARSSSLHAWSWQLACYRWQAASALAYLTTELRMVIATMGLHGCEISGRVKGAVSLRIKMQIKQQRLGEINDLLGLRVVVPETVHCYTVLRALLDRWPAVTRPDDYITFPKHNGYQSLHAVMLDERSGLRFEVRARTRSMHWQAEAGAAAHRSYKLSQLSLLTGGLQLGLAA